jgi:hypothetical protein
LYSFYTKRNNETLNSTDLSADKLNIEQIPEIEIHPKFIWAENECNSVVSTQGRVLGSPEFDLESERDKAFQEIIQAGDYSVFRNMNKEPTKGYSKRIG